MPCGIICGRITPARGNLEHRPLSGAVGDDDDDCRLQDSLSKRDLCVLLTACICHDLDHPGFNNTYQINAKTELAIR